MEVAFGRLHKSGPAAFSGRPTFVDTIMAEGWYFHPFPQHGKWFSMLDPPPRRQARSGVIAKAPCSLPAPGCRPAGLGSWACFCKFSLRDHRANLLYSLRDLLRGFNFNDFLKEKKNTKKSENGGPKLPKWSQNGPKIDPRGSFFRFLENLDFVIPYNDLAIFLKVRGNQKSIKYR